MGRTDTPRVDEIPQEVMDAAILLRKWADENRLSQFSLFGFMPVPQKAKSDRHLGKFSIAMESLRDGSALPAFRECVILDARHRGYENVVDFIGISRHFEWLAEGLAIPVYTCKIENGIARWLLKLSPKEKDHG